MYGRKSIFTLVCLFCAILTFFTACGNNTVSNSDTEQDESTQIGDVEECSISQENKRGTSETGISPSSESDGYYRVDTVSKSVSYYDVETEKYITLCAQPGCAHNDATCQAWIGNVYSFVEYHGNIFATIYKEDGSFDLVKKDLANGGIETLYTWKSDSEESYIIIINAVTDNKILLYLRSFKIDKESGYEVSGQAGNLLYNIETGEMRQIFENDDLTSVDILTVCGNYALVNYTPLAQEVLSVFEFEQQYGAGANYELYYSKACKRELRLYDLDDYSYTVIANAENDSLISVSLMYYDKVAYQCGDSIYLFNMTSNESKKLFTMEGIVNYWIMDKKVFLITGDQSETDDINIYYAALDGGNPIRLNNAGNTEEMEFNINYEGNSFFIGHWNDGDYIISKADFYAERYENARLI